MNRLPADGKLASRAARGFLVYAARAWIYLSPGPLVAAGTRVFMMRGSGKGLKILEAGSFPSRVLARAAAPFSVLTLEVGGRRVEVDMVCWLAWFRTTPYYRLLSRKDMVDISSRVSGKTRLRMIVPPGAPLPVAPYPGAAVDATGEVLSFLVERFAGRT